MARLVGASQADITRWEEDSRRPSGSQRRLLAFLFGCSMDELFSPVIYDELNQ